MILRNFDRLSMAHGVEIRAPFLDWRLVAYAFSLPSTTKIGNGYTKYILRRAMHGILPESIRLRKDKIGFSSPMIDLYKNSMKPFILDSLNSQEFLESSMWNGKLIRDYIEKCYINHDYKSMIKSWKYIQVMILMRRLRNR